MMRIHFWWRTAHHRANIIKIKITGRRHGPAKMRYINWWRKATAPRVTVPIGPWARPSFSMRAGLPAIYRQLATTMRSISILIAKPRGSHRVIGARRQGVISRGRVSSRGNHASYSLPQIWIESGQSPASCHSLRKLLGHGGCNRFRITEAQKGVMLLAGAAPSDDELST